MAVVLLAHAGLLGGWLHQSASGLAPLPPHRVAALRLVAVGPVVEPRPPAPPVRPMAQEDAVKAPSALPPGTPAPSGSAAATPQPMAVAGHSSQAPEHIASAPPSPEVQTPAPVREFFSPREVDRIAIAFPSPDVGLLAGLTWSGLPMRLRLFVSASGQCVDVKVLQSSEDGAAIDRVRQMFLATHFIPARRAGQDVDSYRDIELDASNLK